MEAEAAEKLRQEDDAHSESEDDEDEADADVRRGLLLKTLARQDNPSGEDAADGDAGKGPFGKDDIRDKRASPDPARNELATPTSRKNLIWLNLPWFGMSFLRFLLMVELLPGQIKTIVGDTPSSSHTKGLTLGLTVAGGAFVTLLASPIVGLVSDRSTSRFGRRRLFMVSGVILMTIFMLLMGTITTVSTSNKYCDITIVNGTETGTTHVVAPCKVKDLVLYLLAYFGEELGFAIFSVSYHGLIADKTPMKQRGFSSGAMGVFTAIGTLFGALAGVFYLEITVMGVYSLCAVIMWLTITPACVVLTEARPIESEHDRRSLNCMAVLKGYYEPLREHDFRWVFLTRFLMQMGVATISFFLEYFLSDIITLPTGMSAERAVGVIFLPLLLVAAPASALAGLASDRLGQRRKAWVISSGIVLAVCVSCFITVRAFAAVVVLALFVGVGFGIFLSVDFAMVMDVIPHNKDHAKDLAVWHQALVLPQMIATPIGGIILDAFANQACLDTSCNVTLGGYALLFGITAAYFLLGSLFVLRIRGIK